MKDQAIWTVVHAHLDAGRDPLDDPAVQDALLADPDALQQIVAMRAVLTWAGAVSRPKAEWRRWAAAAAAAVVFVGAAAFYWSPRAPVREPLPMPNFATAGSVRRVVVELGVQAGDQVVWVQREEGVMTRQRSTMLVTMDAEPPTPGRSAMVVALAYFQNQLR